MKVLRRRGDKLYNNQPSAVYLHINRPIRKLRARMRLVLLQRLTARNAMYILHIAISCAIATINIPVLLLLRCLDGLYLLTYAKDELGQELYIVVTCYVESCCKRVF